MRNPRIFDGRFPKKVVILRALQLGDLLCAVPAFRALRAAMPLSHFTLVGLPWAREFVKRFRLYFDDFVAFPGFPGFPERPLDILGFRSFLIEMQERSFDLAIQMQGSGGIANSLVGLWGAAKCAGFYLPGEYCPDENLFLQYPESEPEVRRHLRLLEYLGIPLQGEALEFPLFEDDWKSFYELEDNYGLQKDYVCIHPGARLPERRWPATYFASVADGLAALGYRIILTGSKEEAGITASVSGQMKMPVTDLGGKTNLGALAALVSRARLVVSNDTSISHVAAAFKVPSVVLFSASDPFRWAPLNSRLHKSMPEASHVTAMEVLVQAENHLQEVNFYAS